MPTQFNTLCQEATLYDAWNVVKSKGSAGGVDGVTIEEFNKENSTCEDERTTKDCSNIVCFHSLLAEAVFDLLVHI